MQAQEEPTGKKKWEEFACNLLRLISFETKKSVYIYIYIHVCMCTYKHNIIGIESFCSKLSKLRHK